MNFTNDNIPWNETIKKEARSNNNQDLGKVKEIQGNYVIVQKGIIKKKKYYIPKDQAESYTEDNILQFNFSETDLSKYQNEPFYIDAESNTLESDINKLKEGLD